MMVNKNCIYGIHNIYSLVVVVGEAGSADAIDGRFQFVEVIRHKFVSKI